MHSNGLTNLFFGLAAFPDGKAICPLSINRVQDILTALFRQRRCESVFLASNPALSTVVDLTNVSRRRYDSAALVELNVR